MRQPRWKITRIITSHLQKCFRSVTFRSYAKVKCVDSKGFTKHHKTEAPLLSRLRCLCFFSLWEYHPISPKNILMRQHSDQYRHHRFPSPHLQVAPIIRHLVPQVIFIFIFADVQICVTSQSSSPRCSSDTSSKSNWIGIAAWNHYRPVSQNDAAVPP